MSGEKDWGYPSTGGAFSLGVGLVLLLVALLLRGSDWMWLPLVLGVWALLTAARARVRASELKGEATQAAAELVTTTPALLHGLRAAGAVADLEPLV